MTTVENALRPGVVGRSVERRDGPAKLRGKAQFAGDIELPRMVFGKVLRSTIPSGLIRSIDTSAAEAMPGVVCVMTAADLEDIDPFFGHAVRDRPVLAIDRVRFVGEPVAAVAAETEAIATAALDAIVVDYEELAAVGSVDDALAPDAPIVQEGPLRSGPFWGGAEVPELDGNVCLHHQNVRGDVEDAFERAAFVVEGEYRFPAVYQYSMETHTTVARVDGEQITVWASCQHPFLVRAEIAGVFQVPIDSVQVIVPYLGGGFGSKSYTKIEPLAATLARKAGRPVRIQNRVDESMATTRRHNMKCVMRTAMSAEGELLGRESTAWLDTGAYVDNGLRVTVSAGDGSPGPYRWPAFRVASNCVFTNTAPAGSYRGFGASHMMWISESQIEELSRRAGLDPLEVRRRNLCRPGEMVLRPTGKPLDADLVGDVERAAAAIGWGGPRKPFRGRGLAVGLGTGGAHPVSTAIVRLEANGHAKVLVGTTEIGQGSRTAFAQIAAEEMGLTVESVTVEGTDTRFTPFDRSTGASRSTTLAGLGVLRAARDVRTQLEEIAGTSEIDPAAIPDIIRRYFGFPGGELIGRGEVKPQATGEFAAGAVFPSGPIFWEVACAGVELEVDPDTGVITLLKTAGIADVGRAINPQLVERQDEGATLQGIGNALFEEMLWSDGYPLNDNLLAYRIPSFTDMPQTMETIVVENEDGPGPYGAKGCGEGALAATIAAIVNALADAGVPMRQLPLTPERVWRRIEELKAEGAWPPRDRDTPR
ncbi:MAG TPA: xanthine dehydrogenase family protein molybdopterin-binding subunit [Gaiellaceae bacterium]